MAESGLREKGMPVVTTVNYIPSAVLHVMVVAYSRRTVAPQSYNEFLIQSFEIVEGCHQMDSRHGIKI